MIQDGYYQFGNGGLWCDRVNDFEYKIIAKEAEEIRNDFEKAIDSRSELIGHIDKAFKLKKSRDLIERVVLTKIEEYKEYHSSHQITFEMGFPIPLRKNLKLKLDGCWINFQKKYDFQPMHDHAGVYSFIIFYDIPYDIEEEKAASPCVQGGDARVNGHLEFHYVDYKGRICTMSIPADKNWHGRLIIFPADLKHSVNPFYSSDEYRITISGNLAFEYQE